MCTQAGLGKQVVWVAERSPGSASPSRLLHGPQRKSLSLDRAVLWQSDKRSGGGELSLCRVLREAPKPGGPVPRTQRDAALTPATQGV